MFVSLSDIQRFAFGFCNPNHAAAMICALLPLCWGWRRYPWMGSLLSLVLFSALLLTQSRTGILVIVAEAVLWSWTGRKTMVRTGRMRLKQLGLRFFFFVLSCLTLWWLWPRLGLDESIMNRPKIYLAGLQLFVANPNGVGLGNSGAIASAFLLNGIPETRTMINAHITLLAEFGWIAGWVWFAFIILALSGIRKNPRIGIVFAGLALSGCSSTIFDWSVLFDFAEQGRYEMLNWALSWVMFAMFMIFGTWLIFGATRCVRGGFSVIAAVVLAGVVLSVLLLVPMGNAPQVHAGYVIYGKEPRTLALYDMNWKLTTVAKRVTGDVVFPVRGISEFPRKMDWSRIDRVVLFGDCCEWRHLIKGVSVECVEE